MMAFLSHACARAYACVILLINNYNILYNFIYNNILEF